MTDSRLAHGSCRRADGASLSQLPGAKKHYPPDLALCPQHLDMTLQVFPLDRTLAANVLVTLESRQAARRVILHGVALRDLAVTDPAGAEIAWRYDGETIDVSWSSPFAPGERRQLRLAYRVVDPATGLLFSAPSDEDPTAPVMAVTDCETERARHWLPTIDHPSARPRLDFHIRADAGLTVLANGVQVSDEAHQDGTRTVHWRLDAPCPSYLMCFAVGDFVRWDAGEEGGVPLACFATREHTAGHLQRTFGDTARMMRWMTAKLGLPFPYPKYFQVAVPGIGGAMENISLTTWDDSLVCDDALRAEWGHVIDSINVHEMGHSYFGDLVVCRDFAHAWLKESWATYLELCWVEDQGSADEAAYTRWLYLRDYLAEADERYKRPVVMRRWLSSYEIYDRHLYPGGACRLHMLRQLLGDGTFWTAVSEYLRRFSNRLVETEDFRRVLEEHSGLSLARFFEQWFYEPGYPKLKVSFSYDREREEGSFDLEQTQLEGAPQDTDPFPLEVDLAWVLGASTHRTRATMTERRRTVVVAMPAEPEQVRVDPDGWLVARVTFDPGGDLLKNQLRHAPDAPGRWRAARELARTGKRVNLEAVRDAYLAEPFWGGRVEIAEALAEAGTEVAVSALAGFVRRETDPRALAPLFRAAGKLRAQEVREALLERQPGALPPRARAAWLGALGAQREHAPLDLLLGEAADTTGYGQIALKGALHALAASRLEAAGTRLEAAAAPGALPSRARPAAVEALGSFGQTRPRHERQRLGERLADMLRDNDGRIRRAAVAALESLGDPVAIPALEAHARSLDPQERVQAERAVLALRHADETPAAGKKELERLEARVAELEAAVRRLEGGKDS